MLNLRFKKLFPVQYINQDKSVILELFCVAKSFSKAIKLVVLALVVLGLAACGGSGGASTVVLPDPNIGTGSGAGSAISSKAYEGAAAPRDADVQNFRSFLWSRIAAEDRCGDCHVIGGQASQFPFVHDDDINVAYDAAIGFVELGNPANSRLVTKVLEGHNCWEEATISQCGSAIESYIVAWAAASAPSSFLASLKANAPVTVQEIDEGKRFPATAAEANFSTLHNIVTDPDRGNCLRCHAPSRPAALPATIAFEGPQQPYFAVADIQTAYQAAQSKIDINQVTNSRLYIRLASERHNCWTNSCSSDSQIILDAISALNTPEVSLDSDLLDISSKALKQSEGFILSNNGSRVEDNVVGLWDFKRDDAEPTKATNKAPNGLKIDLILSGDVEWKPSSGGVKINAGKLQADIEDSESLFTRIRETGEYSIEAWVVPLNVTQGENNPAAIVSYSKATDTRNFALAQRLYNYDFYNRNTLANQQTDAGGNPALSTPDAQEILQASLQHVVATYNATDGRRIYVNGELILAEEDASLAGGFQDWLDNFSLVVGNEASGGRQWQGGIRLLAIHNEALTIDDVNTNYEIGVGDKSYLMFSVAHLTEMPGTYVVFRVEEFDEYSYLFSEPLFYNADGERIITNLDLSGLRIGINGRESESGQAYINLVESIDSSSDDYIYDTEKDENGDDTGIEIIENGAMFRLSSVGTIIPIELLSGSNPDDQFFLTFDKIDSIKSSRPSPPPLADFIQPSVPDDTKEQSYIGLKNFAEVNASLSKLTGISSTDDRLRVDDPDNDNEDPYLYDNVKQQMPISESISGFVSAHQMAITQLAVKYCDALTKQELIIPELFDGFDFSASLSTAFNNDAKKNQIINPLLDRLLAGTTNQTEDQPQAVGPAGPVTTVAGDAENIYGSQVILSDLIETLVFNNTASTEEVVTATCAAAFGSAMMLIQ